MSWWVVLIGPDGEPVIVPHFQDGGTQPVGGTNQAELNVTYNYGPYYRKHLHKESIYWLHGKRAGDTIMRLEQAVRILGTKRSEDYWRKTPGNAGYALNILLQWAKQYPEARFQVS